MGVGGQVGLPDAGQQFGERGVAGQVRAQDQRVDEHADQLFEVLVDTSGCRGADRDVVPGAEPGQQGRQGGLHHHEDAHVVGPGEGSDPCVEFGGDVEAVVVSRAGGHGGTGAVAGHRQFFGEVRQGLPPVRELAVGAAAGVAGLAEEGVLPQGVVGVLQRQRRPVGGVALPASGVRGGQVADESFHGPAVGGDMVDDEQQDMFGAGDREQSRAQGRFGAQVETFAGGRCEGAVECVRGDRLDRQRGV